MFLMRMRRLRRCAALGVVAAFAIYLHETSGDDPPVQAPPVATPRSAPASGTEIPVLVEDDAIAASEGAVPGDLDTPILDDVRRIGEASSALAALPEPDRAWVLERASTAFAVGQISQDVLADHIEELASVRQFAVLEREAPYTPPEDVQPQPEAL